MENDDTLLISKFQQLAISFINSVEIFINRDTVPTLRTVHGVVQTTCHVVDLNGHAIMTKNGIDLVPTRKQAYAELISIFESAGEESPLFVQYFLTDEVRACIENNFDRLILNYNDSVMFVPDFFHKLMVMEITINKSERLSEIYTVIVDKLALYVEKYSNYDIKVKKGLPRSLHNRYNKALSNLKYLYNQILTSPSTEHNLMVIVSMYANEYKNDPKGLFAEHNFEKYCRLYHLLIQINSPIYGTNKVNNLCNATIRSLMAIAMSSAILDTQLNLRTSANKQSYEHFLYAIAYMKNRTFFKFMSVIRKTYLKNFGRMDNRFIVEATYSECKSKLDEVIENRIAKKQLFNN